MVSVEGQYDHVCVEVVSARCFFCRRCLWDMGHAIGALYTGHSSIGTLLCVPLCSPCLALLDKGICFWGIAAVINFEISQRQKLFGGQHAGVPVYVIRMIVHWSSSPIHQNGSSIRSSHNG